METVGYAAYILVALLPAAILVYLAWTAWEEHRFQKDYAAFKRRQRRNRAEFFAQLERDQQQD